jgi:hypothetical protein
MSGEQQREILRKLSESTKALEDFLKPSVAAPFKSKLHDWPGTTGTIRGFDLYFCVRGKLEIIKPEDLDGQGKKNGNAQAGGMQFEGRSLDDAEVKELGLITTGKTDRFGQIECSILEKVEAKMTNRTLSTRSDGSLVVATQTLGSRPGPAELQSRWRAIERQADETKNGPRQP